MCLNNTYLNVYLLCTKLYILYYQINDEFYNKEN